MRTSLLLIALLVLLSGCGGQKADVTLFMMAEKGITDEAAKKLKEDLLAWAGEDLNIDFVASPMYFQEKLIAEIVGGNNDIMIVPYKQFYSMATFDGYADLSDLFDVNEFPEGVLELERVNKGGEKEVQVGLYAIPMDLSSWYQRSGMEEKGLVAYILTKSKRLENARKVVQWIARE